MKLKKIIFISICIAICTGNVFACKLGNVKDKIAVRYNVLMIIVDDQKAFLNSLNDTIVKIPNLDRLAEKSLTFAKAYCAAPACCPSRTALLTGLQPASTGVYLNNQYFRQTNCWLKNVVDLPTQFKNNGYLTANFGKVFHNRFQDVNWQSFSDGYFTRFITQEDLELENKAIEVTRLHHPMWYYGPLPNDFDLEDTTKMQQDTKNTSRVIELLHNKHDKPFFCALGFWKPHGPWFVPERYFDKYPISNIKIPKGYNPDDLDDIPEFVRRWATVRGIHKNMIEKNIREKTIQAYYASITYADEQIGRVLDALEKSEYANNTIVLLIGDNGFHNEEKNHWSKFTLWDIATRVPIMISLSEKFQSTGKTYLKPVGLINIYPTLLELCDLPFPEDHHLDGTSLIPILKNTEYNSGIPLVSTWGRNCMLLLMKNNTT